MQRMISMTFASNEKNSGNDSVNLRKATLHDGCDCRSGERPKPKSIMLGCRQ